MTYASGESATTSVIGGVLDRPRLYRILDAPVVRVCIVEGPSGVGKTTLVRNWATQQPVDVQLAWIPLGHGVDDREAFWQHVVATVKRLGVVPDAVAGHVGERLETGLDSARVAGSLLAEAGQVTLVLDAYEQTGDAMADIDRDITRLLLAAPELRLVVTVRGSTALTDLELVGTAISRVVTMTDLAFTENEIGQLLGEQTGIEDEHLVRSLFRSTRGYALTVRAALLALSRLGRIPQIGSIDWDAVMAARLEAQLPDDVAVRFVEKTSVAPYFDVELAQRLSGHEDAVTMLDLLERHGFGRWIPYARDRLVFQYVESIRDVFRSRAADEATSFGRACVTTAEWLLASGDVDQALRFAIEGRDYDLADRIYVRVVTTKPDSYVTSRYLPLLRAVPEDVLASHPMLAFGLGLALTANAALRAEAPRILRIAAESSAQPAYLEPAVDAFSLAGMRAIAWRLAFSFARSADAALKAVDLIDEIDRSVLAPVSNHVGTVLRQLSYSLLQGGHLDDALAATTRSVTLSTSQTVRNYSISYAAGMNAFSGDLVRARSHLSAIDGSAWPEDLQKSYMTGFGIVAEAYLLLDAMDFDGVCDLLRDVDVYMPQAEFWPFHTAVSMVARHALGHGRAESDRVMASLAASFPPPGVGDNIATAHLHGVLAHVLIADGDVRAAQRVVQEQPADSPHLASARIALMVARGALGSAMRRADELLELPGHTIRSQSAARTFAAVAALRERRPEEAWTWLSAAAVASETHGTRAHVSLIPKLDLILLKQFATSRNSMALMRMLEVNVAHTEGSPRKPVALTPREKIILAAFAEYGSVRQVAEALVVSPHTVKTQLQGVYRKLGVSSRSSALSVARDLGLINSEG